MRRRALLAVLGILAAPALVVAAPTAIPRRSGAPNAAVPSEASRRRTIEPANLLNEVHRAQALEARGAIAQATALMERILHTVETQAGPSHPTTAATLSALARLLQKQGEHRRAEALHLRVLAIFERLHGSGHADTAAALQYLADFYDGQYRWAQAEFFHRRAVAAQEQALGPDDPATAPFLNNLAVHLMRRAAYDKAEPLLQRALSIVERHHGPFHPDTAATLINLGTLHQGLDAYDKAQALFTRAHRVAETSQGAGSPLALQALGNLAFLFHVQGAYPKAEALYLKVLAGMEGNPATAPADGARVLMNLAQLHGLQSNYGQAEPLLLRALALQRRALGARHPETGLTLNNLAQLHVDQGAYGRAEPLLRQALAISESTLGPSHPATVLGLNNLAQLHQRSGNPERAEPLLRRALTISETSQGRGAPGTAIVLNNLAQHHLQQGAFAQAEALLLRALSISDNAFGADHPTSSGYLLSLAETYRQQGSAVRAEPLYRRALTIQEQRLGAEHPVTANTRTNLALLLATRGDLTGAEPLLRQGIRSQTLFLQREIPLLPESRRLPQIRSVGNAWELIYTLAASSGAGTDLALFTRLNRHGLLQDIERRQALLARAPGPQQELSQRVAALTRRLAAVDLPAAQRQALQQQRQQLEQQLYRQLPALQARLVEPASVARALPGDGVLIEFQRYRPFDGRASEARRWGEPRYLALVLQPSGAITATDLGPADPIDALIRQALAVSEKGESPADPLWQQVAGKVLAPLLPQLAGRRRWFLSPDGELNRIPYAALPAPGAAGSSGQRLVQAVQLRLLTSGRDLLPAEPTPAAQRPLVVAGPDFGGASPWAALPAAAREGLQVARQLNASLIEGSHATATALGQAHGPRVLHVASHGFFLPVATDGDPLLASGLVLAGANRSGLPNRLRPPAAASVGTSRSAAATTNHRSGAGDDGYLTAKEAAQLQLDGTDLVVLSACDTGSGTPQGGEGLYGLQRALTVAGARSTLLSLWKVDDAATAQFMQRYYTLLKAGKGRQEALVMVQEEFRSNPLHREWKDHRYWAAWQLSGDPSPLPGL